MCGGGGLPCAARVKMKRTVLAFPCTQKAGDTAESLLKVCRLAYPARPTKHARSPFPHPQEWFAYVDREKALRSEAEGRLADLTQTTAHLRAWAVEKVTLFRQTARGDTLSESPLLKNTPSMPVRPHENIYRTTFTLSPADPCPGGVAAQPGGAGCGRAPGGRAGPVPGAGREPGRRRGHARRCAGRAGGTPAARRLRRSLCRLEGRHRGREPTAGLGGSRGEAPRRAAHGSGRRRVAAGLRGRGAHQAGFAGGWRGWLLAPKGRPRVELA